jgi:hypothetical protein
MTAHNFGDGMTLETATESEGRRANAQYATGSAESNRRAVVGLWLDMMSRHSVVKMWVNGVYFEPTDDDVEDYEDMREALARGEAKTSSEYWGYGKSAPVEEPDEPDEPDAVVVKPSGFRLPSRLRRRPKV